MSKTNVWENGVLDLVFLNIPFTLLGDAAGLLGSGAAGSLYISLHTANPDEGGDQTTNECAYPGYNRIAVPRSALGFVRTGNVINPVNPISFPAASSGGMGSAPFFGVGTSAAGAGKLLYKGSITPAIPFGVGITPTLDETTNITED